jgi:DMSO/TMAO reductase YedYZ molybdopterin-dependent catalytic subunit
MVSHRSVSRLSRRAVLQLSGAALVGLTPIAAAAQAAGQAPAQPAPFPDSLVAQKPRDITPLPLNPDGSAKEFSVSELTPVAEIGVLDRNANKTPQIELDPAKAKIKIYGNVMGKRGSLSLADLQSLPPRTQITRLQCGSPKPTGIIKWSGARFSDVCKLLQVDPMAQYVMFVAADGFVTTEDMAVATHPQSMLAWMMNDGPIPVGHGAPFRFVVPTRWGGRNIKRVAEIRFTATTFGFNAS